MSKDDYHVVLYKVLAYLYECLKHDVKPIIDKTCELADVEYGYWQKVVLMAYENGYIKGIHPTAYKHGGELWYPIDVTITEKGIEYLMTNSLMAKAKDILGKTFALMVDSAVAVTRELL